MTIDISMWILGVALVPFIGWCFYTSNNIAQCKKDVYTLVKMHQSPDKFGFGTVETNRSIVEVNEQLKECIRDNTRAIRSLVHYIEWMSKTTTGTTPPPPITEGD